MYKVIDLGFQVESTGEKRVQLLDNVFTKTASSEIQKFWDSLERKKDCVYLWVIGVSAMEYYGCNNNGDSFTEQDLKDYHNTFVSNAHVFLHHVNKDPNKSIGKPVYSFYNDVMHRVEIIMEINKNAAGASDTVIKIKNGEPIYVSMGCNVAHDVCSICNNKARHRGEYCNHLKYNMKKILPDGRQVYALNPKPKFFDISIVRKPADPTAFTLDKAASVGYANNSDDFFLSADLGQQSIDYMEKQAAIKKLSDLIKRVDGQITDLKDEDGDVNVLRDVARQGFDNFEYPELDYEELNKNQVGPGALAKALAAENAPITIGDSIYMAGRHCFGDSLTPGIMGSILNSMPSALPLLSHSQRSLPEIVSDMFRGCCDDQQDTTIVIKIIRPVARARVSFFSKMASVGGHAMGVNVPVLPNTTNSEEIHKWKALLSENVPGNLREVTTVGLDGKTYRTNYGEIRNTDIVNQLTSVPKKIAGAALLAAAISALVSDPSNIKNLATALVTGGAGAALFTGDNSSKVPVQQGFEVPANTFFSKSASSNMAAYAGIAVPAALGMDYLYNKWKFKDQDPEWHLRGPSLYAHKAGKFVVDNPVTSIVSGALVGQTGRNLLKSRGWLKDIPTAAV